MITKKGEHMKNPKEPWQIAAISKLQRQGMTYEELAKFIGYEKGTVCQAMCKNYSDTIKNKICEYLGV